MVVLAFFSLQVLHQGHVHLELLLVHLLAFLQAFLQAHRLLEPHLACGHQAHQEDHLFAVRHLVAHHD